MSKRSPMHRGVTRRDFVRGLGAGAALAGTFFNSRVAMGQTGTAPVRLLLIPLQHGWGRDRNYGNFSGTEDNFVIPAPLTALEAIRDRCTFVDGLRGTLWGNAHDVSYSDMFTASVPWDENSSEQLGNVFPEPMGPSIDWLIGDALGVNVLRLSAGYQSWGKAHNPMSFDKNAREQAFYTSARAAYDALIDPLNQNVTTEVDHGREAVRDQLFAFLGRDTQRMLGKVSGTERLKLEGYLEAVNDLGNRISGGNGGLRAEDIPPAPGMGLTFEEEMDHMFELVRVAFMADTHRVAVLGLGEHYDAWEWTDSMGQARVGNIWGADFHHEVAHYENADMRLAFEGWAHWYVQKLVGFVQRLAQTPDVDGRMLIDNTLIVLTGEVETGGHDTRMKLHPVIGGGGGIRSGRWLHLPEVEPRDRKGVFIGGTLRDGTLVESGINYGLPFGRHHHADLWVSIANLCGVPITSFGFDDYNYQPIALV